ncbi:MAG: hypothetical protein JW754_03685 [Candidatus Aenigmarchaeota archaeon]|nr:hypothetical protein [Candidatus Aenigmarchaeota archaeon]
MEGEFKTYRVASNDSEQDSLKAFQDFFKREGFGQYPKKPVIEAIYWATPENEQNEHIIKKEGNWTIII